MKKLEIDREVYDKLLIDYGGTEEDHRLQLVSVNGSIFSIFHTDLEMLGPIKLHCMDWSLILMAPIKSQSSIEISGINVICLNEITSEKSVNVNASNLLVKFSGVKKSSQKVYGMNSARHHELNDEPGVVLFYQKCFECVVNSVRNGDLSLAKQQFISALGGLAFNIDEKPENLILQNVLDFWKIPYEPAKI